MARAARAAGFEVHVATRVADGGPAIKAEGFVLHSIPFARGRLAPLAAGRTITALRRLHRKVAPAIVHHVALQAVILGSIAALGRQVASVNALTGLGFAFLSNRPAARFLRMTVGALLRFVLNGRDNVALVQNPDDRDDLIALGILPDHIALIAGSGVDIETLVPSAEPAGPPTAAFLGRLLEDKGIRTLVEAHRLLRARDCDLQLRIGGTPDPANPASLIAQEAADWASEPGITWLGHVADVAQFWASASIAVLPSRREGLPKSLLEAAACGRPLVATDVPGCREIVLQDETGLLVPVDDPTSLADALEKLARSPELRARYGQAARRLAVERFAADAIGRQVIELYRRLGCHA
jgi:glycosyltransferase involved in cell wall biosynthesis